MSLPPLPETFGNYAIRGIAEVLTPTPVSWMPQTTGWVLLAAVVTGLLVRSGYRRYLRWRKNRYRREALVALARLDDDDAQSALIIIPRILKSAALAGFPRTEVAALSGDDWLNWLETTTDSPVFADSSRLLLADRQYRPAPAATPEELRRLRGDCESWVRLHREVCA